MDGLFAVSRLAGSSFKRSAAGDASSILRMERNRIPSDSPASAASCKRRRALESACASQASTTLAVPARSACSTAQSPSCALRGCTMSTRARLTPARASAGAYGTCGGATNTSQRSSSVARASAGMSRESSPIPSRGITISVSAPRGNPPPGNSASSPGKPEGSACTGGAASPRQMSARCKISGRFIVAWCG